MDYNYAIVGNGIAGYSAVKEIRKYDKEGTIVLISSEPYETYYRIQMTELISRQGLDLPLVSKSDWYGENKVDQILHTTCKEIQAESKVLILEDGSKIRADKILLAMGSSAFIPPIAGSDKAGVFSLRNFDDLKEMKKDLSQYEKVTVLGGGILGLEAAYSLKSLGKEVSIVISSAYVMDRQLDPELGRKINDELARLGYHVYTDKRTVAFAGEERVEFLEFEDGSRLKSDLVLISTGVRPNLDLVRTTAISHDRGIIVDEKMRTNFQDIYAAGDVAQVQGRTMGLWTAALEMGKVAGATMVGQEDLSYKEAKQFTKLDMGQIQIFSVGDVGDYDDAYKYEEGDQVHKLFVTKGVVTGAILTGDTRAMGKVRKYVFEHKKIEDVRTDSFPFERV